MAIVHYAIRVGVARRPSRTTGSSSECPRSITSRAFLGGTTDEGRSSPICRRDGIYLPSMGCPSCGSHPRARRAP